jgi:hypothetical protein
MAHFSQIDGDVSRLHRFAPTIVRVGVLVVQGDQVRTAIGRAELRFGDGSLMHLDQHTAISMTGSARFRLLEGRVSFHTRAPHTAETASGSVHIGAGTSDDREEGPESIIELTADARTRDLLVRVVEGQARIESPWGIEAVMAAQTAFVSGPTGRPFVSAWVNAHQDAFLEWSGSRDLPVPATYLPYAHPSYRQSEYERLLRKEHHARARGTDRGRGDAGRDDRRREHDAEGSNKRPSTRDERRRDAEPAPPAKQPRPARAAGAGAVVRPPQ